MRIDVRIVLPLVLAIALSACRASDEAAEPQEAATTAAPIDTATPELDTAIIGQTRDQYIAAVNEANLDGVVSHWADDGVLMPPGQPAVSGKDAIRSWYQERFSQVTTRIDIRSEETHVAGDIAYDRGTLTMTMTPRPAAPAPTPAPGQEGMGTDLTTAAPETPAGPPSAPPPVAATSAGTSQAAKYIVVMRRDATGDWKVAQNIWNFDAPPAGAADTEDAP
ncbi:MAG TPA: nuclear transport factor 2 family protein [Thermoanaerobaculia bacterium]|nr:nuclear transport factor 2 family protein [Thermoanaerobaculia bacterium]